MNAPDHLTVDRLDGPPAYFLRIYDTGDTPFAQMVGGIMEITPTFHDLHIYGFHARSSFAEDREYEAGMWACGSFPAWCFSTEVPEGEPGSVPESDVTEISREQFEAAQARGWAAPE